jgi:hypothetical protein
MFHVLNMIMHNKLQAIAVIHKDQVCHKQKHECMQAENFLMPSYFETTRASPSQQVSIASNSARLAAESAATM